MRDHIEIVDVFIPDALKADEPHDRDSHAGLVLDSLPKRINRANPFRENFRLCIDGYEVAMADCGITRALHNPRV